MPKSDCRAETSKKWPGLPWLCDSRRGTLWKKHNASTIKAFSDAEWFWLCHRLPYASFALCRFSPIRLPFDQGRLLSLSSQFAYFLLSAQVLRRIGHQKESTLLATDSSRLSSC